MGKPGNKCHKLKVHGRLMQQSDSTKYLGDIIHKSTKVTANIAARLVKAAASFSVIRAILEDIPLGIYRIQVGLELRNALFVNSVLFNCETWHSISDADIKDIVLIDHQLIRYICQAQAKTPVKFLYLETGSISLSHIISSRRMNYLYEVITRADSELVKRVYMAQKESPSKGDFVNLVKADFDFIGITYNEEMFCQMSRAQYKSLIHKNIFASAFNEFRSIQAQHSKVRDIPYKGLTIQKYLKSPDFTIADCSLLMAFRSHSVNGFKANFSSIHKKDMSCRLKCDPNQEDSQFHLTSCSSIFSRIDSKYIQETKYIEYSDIYGEPHSQKTAVRHLSTLLEVRQTILDELQSTTPSTSGPTLDTAPPASQGSSGD